ncbi:MAG: glycoside hydrolase 15-related protein, partial [Frankiales bacterium]|nr:glycoside hydrolase 15-related protein [Frankiales bacterium]
TEEAGQWRAWLLRAVAGAPDQLQILYGLGGERNLPEIELDWLAGYEGSKPVRIGNAAARQFQLDVYGEVISALFAARQAGLSGDGNAWSVQRAVLAHLETVMSRPDSGLWEVRGPERHFTYSKVMTWVAFDRAVRSVETQGLEGPVEHWRELRDAIHAEICDQAWNAKLGAFTQYYGGEELDASLLVMPTVGFISGTDARFLSTVDAINRTLRNGVLVDRYQTKEHIDGLPPGEGSFLACSFWLVSALAQAGRLEEAHELFEGLLNLRNDVGLLAEEYDANAGRMTGNFPQAFSHLALVEAATTLEAVGSANRPRGTTKSIRD